MTTTTRFRAPSAGAGAAACLWLAGDFCFLSDTALAYRKRPVVDPASSEGIDAAALAGASIGRNLSSQLRPVREVS
jgi:hypothetical protein